MWNNVGKDQGTKTAWLTAPTKSSEKMKFSIKKKIVSYRKTKKQKKGANNVQIIFRHHNIYQRFSGSTTVVQLQ